ncbi:MAG: alpha/beta hydrolase [Caulobacter sp.]|nr:alpha/beta hydrolase [Caulobacter sp.]
MSDPHIHFDTTGPETGEPLVLIEGLSAQMVAWRGGFVDALVGKGFRVIRLDNRDVGLSQQMGTPDQLGPCYTLDDMAGDVCRVLDQLGIASAHIVGQSMGGAIAQHMAMTFPERVRSLGLFYTAPAFAIEFVSEELRERIIVETQAAGSGKPSPDRQGKIDALIEGARVAASTDSPFELDWHTELATLAVDRCDRMDGAIRQSAAMISAGDWRERLERLTLPVAIFHGRADRLVTVEAALELARRIKTAELHLYPYMGHVIDRTLWDEFATVIARTARRAA